MRCTTDLLMSITMWMTTRDMAPSFVCDRRFQVVPFPIRWEIRQFCRKTLIRKSRGKHQ